MLALIAAQLLLVVSHDLAARGQLHKLERYADRAELAVSLGKGNASADAKSAGNGIADSTAGGNAISDSAVDGNAISDSAIDAIVRWPALVAVELLPPLSARDAASLRRLKRFAVRLPPSFAPDAGAAANNGQAFISLHRARKEIPSLALLGPAMVRVERTPSTALAPGPCPGTEVRLLQDGSSELRIEGDLSRCLLDWLHASLDPHAEPIGEPPQPSDSRSPAPSAAPAR